MTHHPSSQKSELAKAFDLIDEDAVQYSESMERFLALCFDSSELKDKTILDLGCGPGISTYLLGLKGIKSIVGIDISPQRIEIARILSKKHEVTNSYFLIADISDLPIKQLSTDITVAIQSLNYPQNPMQAIDEIIRISKKKSTIILIALKKTKLDPLYELIRKICVLFPEKTHIFMAKFISFLFFPIISLFLRRKVSSKKGKKIYLTILEAFFIPVEMYKFNPEEVKAYFVNQGFDVIEIPPPSPSIDFFSPSNSFLLKIIRD